MNTKSLKNVLLLHVVVLLLLASCAKKPDFLSSIPDSADFVTVIDVQSIGQKGKLDEITEMPFFKSMQDDIRDENEDVYNLMNDLINDPKLSGIDLKTDIFTFHIADENDNNFFCVYATLLDRKQFSDFVQDVFTKSEADYEIDDGDNYKFSNMNDAYLGWDDNKLFLLFAENYRSRRVLDSTLKSLFKVDTDHSIATNTDFNAFYAQKKDLSLWMDLDLFKHTDGYKILKHELNLNVEGSYLYSFLDFQKSKVSLTTQLSPNDEIKEFYSENKILNKKVNPELFTYFPAKNLALLSISVDPMAYYKVMQKDPDFERVESNFESETGFELSELMSSLKGNLVMGFVGFKEFEYSYSTYSYYTRDYVERKGKDTLPLITVAIDINGDELINKLFEQIPENEIIDNGGYYEFKIDRKYPVFLAFNDKACLVTNDINSINAFTHEKEFDKSLAETTTAKELMNSPFLVMANLDLDDYPEEMLRNVFDRDQFSVLNILDKSINIIEFKIIDDYAAEISLDTGDGDNSLNTLITSVANAVTAN